MFLLHVFCLNLQSTSFAKKQAIDTASLRRGSNVFWEPGRCGPKSFAFGQRVAWLFRFVGKMGVLSVSTKFLVIGVGDARIP